MTTIDLGDVTPALAGGPGTEPAPPVDVRRAGRRPMVAFTVVGMMALGGSVVPPEPPVRQVWGISIGTADQVGYAAGSVYVSRPIDVGETLLSAYALGDGERRWSAPVAADRAVPLPADGDVVVLTADEASGQRAIGGGTEKFAYRRTTVALDAATGAELWRTSGEAERSVGGEVLIEKHDGEGNRIRLEKVRARDGVLVWSRPLSPLAQWTLVGPADEPRAVVASDGRGRITEWRYSDGSALLDRAVGGPISGLSASRDWLAVRFTMSGDGQGRDVTRIYRADDLAPRWTLPRDTFVALFCEPALCVTDDEGMAGVDPATGASWWRRSGPWASYGIGDLIYFPRGDAQAAGFYIVDARTGRAVGEQVDGAVIETVGGRADRQYVLRPAPQPRGPVTVAVLTATGEVTPRGSIDAVNVADCRAEPPYLTCRRGNDLAIIRVD